MKPNTLLNKLLKSVNENQTSILQCGDILYLALYYEYVMDDLWLILNNGKYVHSGWFEEFVYFGNLCKTIWISNGNEGQMEKWIV